MKHTLFSETMWCYQQTRFDTSVPHPSQVTAVKTLASLLGDLLKKFSDPVVIWVTVKKPGVPLLSIESLLFNHGILILRFIK